MSFSNNVRPDRMPGPINGNPQQGLCEKVCIEVRKVFDACIRQETLSNVTLNLTSTTPTNVTVPFTYISAVSSTSRGTIKNLTITPLTDRNGCSRLQFDVDIPMTVVFTDANGVKASGTATLTVSRDIILHIPQASVIPYELEAVVNAVSTVGNYLTDASFNTTICVTVIIKVVTVVDLLVPSYGYCYIPPCQEFQNEVCEGFFDLPLFPQ